MCQDTTPIILNCESEETTIEFLCDAFETVPEALYKFFDSRLSPHDENEDKNLVITSFFEQFGERKEIDYVYFFHGTRVYKGHTFEEEGLLPLPESSDSLWESLYEIIAEDSLAIEEWENFKQEFRSGQHSDLYNNDNRIANENGPFGFFVLEQMTGNNGHGNYAADGSDFTYDICRALANCFDWAEGCYNNYLNQTEGTIVTFRLNADDDIYLTEHVEEAIEYAWRCHFEMGHLIESTPYNGNGEAIPPEDIVDVD